MLYLNDIVLRIGGRALLDGANLHLPAGQRIALVGRNGTGKTSLLRLIAGEMQPDAGTLKLKPGARVATVAQEAPGGNVTPLEAVLAADEERAALLEEEKHVTDPHRIGEVQNRLAEIGAQAAPARAARILKGLGFDDDAQNRPLSTFSGGWRMRVALGAVLFAEPDLLLLDEPTNHLDLEAAMWLEEHLRRYSRTLLIVSHDRDFLNTVPQRIVHLENSKLTAYQGGYDAFEKMRREKMEQLEKERSRQAHARAHIQSFVDRFRYKASKARQAQSRLKLLEKMEPIAQATVEPTIRFDFPNGKLPAPPLITLEEVDAGYGDKVVLRKMSLRIDPDDRIALLGANGNGKSTFAKLIGGRLEPLRGTVTRARGLKVGFFAQHQIEDLTPEATGIEHLRERLPDAREEKLRAWLGRFGLVQAKAETRAANLSGGEKTRLCFALMSLEEPQILILDEPTNHLDIDSRQALVEAINAFEGAVIIVSHDRHLVELTVDALWLVKDGKVASFDGDLDAYRADLLATAAEQRRQQGGQKQGGDRLTGAARRSRRAELRRKSAEAEKILAKLQAEKTRIDAKLANPSTYTDPKADPAALQQRAHELVALIEKAETAWLEIESRIDAL